MAAAYDMLKFGNPESVILADSDGFADDRAACRLKDLLPESAGRFRHARIDAVPLEQAVSGGAFVERFWCKESHSRNRRRLTVHD